jgi:hypothetical protein
VDDVDSLYVEIDNLNNLLVGFCFIRSIDLVPSSEVSCLDAKQASAMRYPSTLFPVMTCVQFDGADDFLALLHVQCASFIMGTFYIEIKINC